MIEPNEVINLVIASMSAVVVYAVIRRYPLTRALKTMLAGYGFMLVALTATIVEGMLFPALFNTIEHLSYTVAAILFALAVRWLVAGQAEGGPE